MRVASGRVIHGKVQMEDAEYLNRKGLTSHQPAVPLFDDQDVERAMKLFVSVPLGKAHIAAPGISFTQRACDLSP